MCKLRLSLKRERTLVYYSLDVAYNSSTAAAAAAAQEISLGY